MAIHIGYQKGKLPGALIAGICFMITSVVITGALAYLYLHYGRLPSVEPFLYGVKPAVIIIIINAVYKLGKKAIKGNEAIISGRIYLLFNISIYLVKKLI